MITRWSQAALDTMRAVGAWIQNNPGWSWVILTAFLLPLVVGLTVQTWSQYYSHRLARRRERERRDEDAKVKAVERAREDAETRERKAAARGRVARYLLADFSRITTGVGRCLGEYTDEAIPVEVWTGDHAWVIEQLNETLGTEGDPIVRFLREAAQLEQRRRARIEEARNETIPVGHRPRMTIEGAFARLMKDLETKAHAALVEAAK